MSSQAQPFWRYFPACSLATLFVAWASVLLWSEIGLGEESLNFLGGLHFGSLICFAIMAGAAFVLYLLDFFNPPHIANKYCTFREDAELPTGPVIILGFVVLMLAACVMEADTYPWMPVLLMSFTTPALLVLVYRCTGVGVSATKEHMEDGPQPGGATSGAADTPRTRSEFHKKLQLINDLQRLEEDEQGFYWAAGTALVSGAALLLGGWMIWISLNSTHFESVEDASSSTDRQKHIIVWVSPVVTALALFAIAVLVAARLKFGELYNKNKAGLRLRSSRTDIREKQRKQKVQALIPEFKEEIPQEYYALIDMFRYVVKCFVCALVILISGFYFMYLLATEHQKLMLMVEAFLFLLFIHATAFLYISFRPVWQALGQWLEKQPLLVAISTMAKSDWARALAIFCFAPLLPLLVVVSLLNQLVRRCRQLPEPPTAQLKQPSTSGLADGSRSLRDIVSSRDSNYDPIIVERHLLTTRVRLFLQDAAQWDWTVLLPKTYIIGIAAAVYVLTPIMLNVCLSCMVSLLQPYPMSIIMLAVWLLGLLLFLLPPIPGAPVYLFSGVLVTGKASTDWGGVSGFWIGAGLSILLCWVLKLSACAMQQQLIGAMLGTRDQVRKMVGVHKPFIRAIESILRQRGFSFGKVVILCGGPDWPTSVLAGVLKLSLLQCEIGTMPIIIYIAPLSLTGSFYYKQDDGDVWRNAGALMFAITALMTIALWVAMAWVVQHVFDKDADVGELTEPKEEYEELDWMDYRTEQISIRCKKKWSEVPLIVRVAASTGCVCLIFSAQAMFWKSGSFFADFEISDDVRQFSLIGTGDQSLITIPGLFVLTVAAFSCLGWLVLSTWTQRATEECRPRAEEEVDAQRDEWKNGRQQRASTSGSSVELPKRTPSDCQEAAPQASALALEPPVAERDAASNSIGAVGDRVQPLGVESVPASRTEGQPQDCSPQSYGKPEDALAEKEAAAMPLRGSHPKEKRQPRNPSQKKSKPRGSADKATSDSVGNANPDGSGTKSASLTSKPSAPADPTRPQASRPVPAKQKTDGQLAEGKEGSKRRNR